MKRLVSEIIHTMTLEVKISQLNCVEARDIVDENNLSAGDARRVEFTLYIDQLAFHDREYKRIVEPGRFKVMAGSSSSDIRLEGIFSITGIKKEINSQRKYFSDVRIF